MFPTLHVGGGDEDFERRIARARSHAGERGIDAYRTSLDRDNAVRDPEAQVMMRMNSALRLGLEDAVIGRQPCCILIHRHRAAAVGDIDAVRAIALPQLGLLPPRLETGRASWRERR